MSQEPKKRHSRQRKGKRRAGIRLSIPTTVICKNCGSRNLPHTICESCGYYKGQQVIVHKVKQKEQEA